MAKIVASSLLGTLWVHVWYGDFFETVIPMKYMYVSLHGGLKIYLLKKKAGREM